MVSSSMPQEERAFWEAVRMALLTIVDALERWLKIEPRTAVLRKRAQK